MQTTYHELDGEAACAGRSKSSAHEGINSDELQLKIIGFEWLPLAVLQQLYCDVVFQVIFDGVLRRRS